jgi:hypothetical protein
VLIETRSVPFGITNPGGNVTSSTITAPAPFAATPTGPTALLGPVGAGVSAGDGVVAMGQTGDNPGMLTPNGVQLIPFGVGFATGTFNMAVYGWRRTTGAIALWVPFLLAQFVCTLCTTPGVDSADVNSSQLFCDTIQLVVGNVGISCEITSPGGNQIAHAIVNAKGARFLEVRFGTGNSATSCNALAATL